MFKNEFTIGNKKVGGDNPSLFIAEGGVSHFGDVEMALDLVDLAAEAGADIFKTQFFDVDELFASRAEAWKDRLRPRNLTLDEAHRVKERCDEKGILFASTAHDESRIEWLRELDVPVIKVGSGERSNPQFLRRLAELGKPMIVSTGMYGEEDIQEALDACQQGGCDEVGLLHCVTSYPTPDDQINLASMDRMNEIFSGPVGYSDHTVDFMAVLAAVARGAQIIEKHITILRDVPNAQDWKVSAGPENLASLIEQIRRIETAVGRKAKAPVACEEAGMSWAIKSLVAARDLTEGTVIGEADLKAKRPGDGILPSRMGEVIGRKLKRAVPADDAIQFADLT